MSQISCRCRGGATGTCTIERNSKIRFSMRVEIGGRANGLVEITPGTAGMLCYCISRTHFVSMKLPCMDRMLHNDLCDLRVERVGGAPFEEVQFAFPAREDTPAIFNRQKLIDAFRALCVDGMPRFAHDVQPLSV